MKYCSLKYCEYLMCAKKHLDAGESILNTYKTLCKVCDDKDVLLELYYLSGYIIEGVVVYSVYKLFSWDDKKDITAYDQKFTEKSGIDFYGERRRLGRDCFPLKGKGILGISNHNFQEIIEKKLKDNPSFNNVPYIGSGKIDEDVCGCIDEWSPKARYCYCCQSLDENLMIRIYETCFKILSQVQSKI